MDAAEKWSIENSDRFDDTEATIQQVGLNIVFVVDVSGSMKSNLANDNTANPWTNSRYKATADAIQAALTTLKENPLNKVSFVFYSGMVRSGTSGCSASSSGTFTSTCSLRYQTALADVTSIGNVTSSDGYIKVGSQSVAVSGGTYTQLGVLKARDILVSGPDRNSQIPVVILLTDGAPTVGRTTLEVGNGNLGNGTETNNKLGQIGQYLIQSLIKTKQDLSSAYGGSTVFMYTIGLGVNHAFGKFVLDPRIDNLSLISTGCPASSTTNNYNTEWARCELYRIYAKDNGSQYNGVITKSFTGTMSEDELRTNFISIAHDVQEATKITQVCVSVEELAREGYLSKSDIKLTDGTSYSDTFVIASFNEATNQYAYAIARTDEQISTCRALASNNN